MTNKITYTLDSRQIVGKKVSQIRKKGDVPGIIHVSGHDSIPVQTEFHSLRKLFDQAGETTLVYAKVGDDQKQLPLVFSEVETDPLSGKITHFVLKKVSLKEKIEAEVPIELEGELDIPQGIAITVRDAVIIKALPTNMPNKIVIDLASLKNIGDVVNVADLKIDPETMEVVLSEDMDPASTPVLIVQDEASLAAKEEAAAEASAEAEAESETGEESTAPEAAAEETPEQE